MGRISDALARAEGQTRTSSPAGEALIPWDFDTPEEPGRTEPPALLPELALSASLSASRVVARTPRKEPALDLVPVETAARLVTSATFPTAVKEQYRRLAATLHRAQQDEGIRVLMVASSLPNEGKTLVAANLGLTLSRSFERRVLLIDGDLRKPSLHAMFGVRDTEPGLANCLDSVAASHVQPLQVAPKLSVMPAGRRHGDSMRVVTSDVMQRVIQEATIAFDWVVLDTPPVGLLADTHVLAAMADRVLLVIEAAKTPYDLIQRSIEVLGRERIIGTVLNRADASQVGPAGFDYHDYSDADGHPAGS